MKNVIIRLICWINNNLIFTYLHNMEKSNFENIEGKKKKKKDKNPTIMSQTSRRVLDKNNK
jgi:hypothetical protein